MTNNHHIGQQIRELRTLLGIPARQLARRIGISDSYIFLIENGRPPTAVQLAKIEAAFGVKLDDPRVKQLFDLLASLRGQDNGALHNPKAVPDDPREDTER